MKRPPIVRTRIRQVRDTLYMSVSLSLPRLASRFSICGAMRRIFYLYIITHRPVVPFFPPSPPSVPRLPRSPFLPALAPYLDGPSSLSSPLIFPTLSSFSCSPLFLRLSPSVLPRSLGPPCFPSRACIYFILLLNKPLPVTHPRANMRLYTHTGDSRQTQSPT